jgi:hypothetical protein
MAGHPTHPRGRALGRRRQVRQKLNDLSHCFDSVAGYTVGTSLGIRTEDFLATGTLVLRVQTRRAPPARAPRDVGHGLTSVR